MKFVVASDHLEPVTLYVHFVAVLKNLHRLQKALSNIIFVVVITQIDGTAHGVRNRVIMMRP